ncbi:MAG: GxxExxY protein [Bacteroidota bacterium]|nr:GxxExxY protein [Bacteroidota bacterium]
MSSLVNAEDYNDLTHAIIGCAMTVHQKLGMGFPEVVYQRSLGIELFKQGLAAEREIELPIYYEDEKVGSRRADFFVERQVLVELKALDTLTPAHSSQLLNYLEAFQIPVGLLLNFGTSRLEIKRLLKRLK